MLPRGGPSPNILAFDTSRGHVAAAVFRDGPLASRTELTERGQAERLMPMLEELLREAGGGWADLDLIAVGIGPGNFTGIRISVAAARGLALSLDIPALGVSMFETILDPAGPSARPAELLSLEAPRGQAYVQGFRLGRPRALPRLIDPDHPPPDLALCPEMMVRGFGAAAIAGAFGASWEDAAPADVAVRIARAAATRWAEGDRGETRPAPLYVRPADAAPPREAPPPLLP